MKRVRKKARMRKSGLSPGARSMLMSGFVMAADEDFPTPEAFDAAWRLHRAARMAECGPFERPHAYWIEISRQAETLGYFPGVAASGYESQRSALIRLGLPLTTIEKNISAMEVTKTF